tara:strand:- start:70 stop:429 length:360 start_codon:yes stop_codon:yes gene_type:complete
MLPPLIRVDTNRKKWKSVVFSTIVLLAVSTLLSACLTVGKSFPDYAVSDIKIGKTTESDIQELFGHPWRTGMDDEDRTWTYGHYQYSLFQAAKTEDLIIRFDKNGLVSSYTFNTTNPTP